MTKRPERRKAADTAGVTAAQPKVSKRKKEYNPVAGYRLPKELKARVSDLAKELKVSSSTVVTALLSWAIISYEKGTLKFDLTPKEYDLSIKK